VIASYNGKSASMPVRVLQPTPLPATPPLASTAFQADHTHAGHLTLGQAPALPLTNRWAATFPGKVSYPVVADGRVFVVVGRIGSNGVLGSSVYALDVNTGATLWGPVEHSSSYMWAAHTYANGKLFVITASGLLRAFDAATGAVIWSVQLPGSFGYSAPPVAANGLVYLSYGASGLMMAVDQQDGALVWRVSAGNGMDSSPTISSNGLFVSYACETLRLDPLSGDRQWQYQGACASGGGGNTAVLAGNLLFAQVYTGASGVQYRTFNTADGAIVSGFAPGGRPAVAGGTAYFVSSGVLHAVDIATNTPRWTYTADPALNTAPLVIDGMVAVGSSAGAVHLIDAATGSPLWSGQAEAGLSATYEGSTNVPAGLGAGGGYLVVPGGSTLTGWKMIQ
jgi:outer membrane protein assembly factor BamB